MAAGAMLRLLCGLILALQVVGQPAGSFGSDECLCSDVAPPGPLTCAQQRDFGKCQAVWMMVPPPEAPMPEGYCQSTCGRCPCPGAPVFEDSAPAMPEDECPCTDIPPPETAINCEHQADMGKCYAVWMRHVDGLPEGYCQITCGLCPCAKPGARSGAPSLPAATVATVARPAAQDPATATEPGNSTAPETADGADAPKHRGRKAKTGKDVVVDKSDMDVSKMVVRAMAGGNATLTAPDAEVGEGRVGEAGSAPEGDAAAQGAESPVEAAGGGRQDSNSTDSSKMHGHSMTRAAGPFKKPKGSSKRLGKGSAMDKSEMVFDAMMEMKHHDNGTDPSPGAPAVEAGADGENEMAERKETFKAAQMETMARLEEGNATGASVDAAVPDPNPEGGAEGGIDMAPQKHHHKAMRVKMMAKTEVPGTSVARRALAGA